MLSPGSRPRMLPRLAGMLLALLAMLGAAGTAAAAPAADAPSASLLISEVYAPAQTAADATAQWFEIYNPTKYSYPLRGIMVGNSKVKSPLNTDVVLGGAAAGAAMTTTFAVLTASADALEQAYGNRILPGQIIVAPELFPLDTQADALLLATPDSAIIIDQVNWGASDRSWPNYNDQMWAKGLNPLASSGKAQSWGRTPTGRDSGTPGDWTIHDTVSPAADVRPTSAQPAFLGPITDWIGAIGSIVLWLAFIIIGIVAYRFETLRQIRTYWQVLLLAPSGLLFYTVVTVLAFQRSGQLSDSEKWWAFTVLAASALFCLVGMSIFRNVARELVEGK